MNDVVPLRPRRESRRAELSIVPGAEQRPVVYDLSHLIARLRARTGTGIDRIDLAFASHFFTSPAERQAARYASGPPRLISRRWAGEFTQAAQSVWSTTENARAEPLWHWLETAPGACLAPRLSGRSRVSAPAWNRRLLSWAGHLVGSRRPGVPRHAIYLNVGYHRFETPSLFAWLAQRSDVDAVFMIHDLLPLDYPEYFAPGESDLFRTRIDTALRYGRAFLVSTQAVRRRLRQEIEARGLAARPIWARPFPSPLASFAAPAVRRAPQHPYFVVVGTIEPRKNHLLLLQIWRELARRSPEPPRLVIVGVRGWENEQVLDLLDRCGPLSRHVGEASDLGSRDLADLIAGARAVLAPSFEEGYGLPIVEALALGTPVVASDTEASREVSQGRARLLSAIDGEGWTREIERLAWDETYHAAQRARAGGFVAPNWPDYFASLDQFLISLRRAPSG